MGILDKIKEKVNTIKEERNQRNALKKEIEAEIKEELKSEIKQEVKDELKDKMKQEMKDQILGKKKNGMLGGLANEFKGMATDDRMDRLLGRRPQQQPQQQSNRYAAREREVVIDVTPNNSVAGILKTDEKIDYMLGRKKR